jgi:hypothetical protein
MTRLRPSTLALVVSVLALSSASALAQDLGRAGPSYAGSGSWPSGTKPQSKLWFHDGKWWGSLFSTSAREFRIHRLMLGTQTWVDTGVTIDPRHTSHADCLSAGDTLYIGSHRFEELGFDGNPMLLMRYRYDKASASYALDPGFPVQIGNSSTEAMVIERDSTGVLWAAWTQGLRVWTAHSLGDDLSWTAPFVLPVSTTDIDADDICSMVAFGGDRIGVLWSDQASNGFYFSSRLDGSPESVWSAPEPIVVGPDEGDDHVCLRASNDGRVFALLKNERDETWLRVRDPASGTWSGHLVASAADGWTRSIVVLDEEHRRLVVLGTRPILAGTIHGKVSSLDAVGFGPGAGFPFLRMAADPSLNDVTSTKQPVGAASGFVALASHQPLRSYWFRFVPVR